VISDIEKDPLNNYVRYNTRLKHTDELA